MLGLPIQPYTTGPLTFGRRIRRRILLWATHLGDDVLAVPGTPVYAIGVGEVVWSEMRLGSEGKRNWGGVVVLRHQIQNSKFKMQNFYSIYGHMTDLVVTKGDQVQAGQQLGVIAPGNTPENGWWKVPHLHFAIYTGPWQEHVLPGYARPDDWLRLSPRRTKRKWWHDPRRFIQDMNEGLVV